MKSLKNVFTTMCLRSLRDQALGIRGKLKACRCDPYDLYGEQALSKTHCLYLKSVNIISLKKESQVWLQKKQNMYRTFLFPVYFSP